MRKIAGLICFLLLAPAAYAQSGIDRTKAMEYMQNQEYDEAIAYLKPNVRDNEIKDMTLLAYAYYQAGRLPQAAGSYEQALRIDGNYLPALQALAAIRTQQERHEQALQLYQHIVQLKPEQASAWKQLSFAAFSARNDSAFTWLHKAYRLNPSDTKVAVRLAEEWINRKNYAAADSVIVNGLVQDSLEHKLLQLAAETSYLRKDYKRTIRLGTILKAEHVLSSYTFSYVIAACYKQEKYKECIEIHDYLAAAKEATENIIYYAAMAYTALNKFKESNELLKECIKMAKSDMLEVYYNCSSANYENLKQYKPAIACLDSSYYLSHLPIRLYSMGRIYEVGLKNETAASKYYKRYLQLYKPGSDDDAAIYKYLKSRQKK